MPSVAARRPATARRAENAAVNAAGLVQGITLVTFPAASSIFTGASDYDLSNTQYGAMFLPQVTTAIARGWRSRCSGWPGWGVRPCFD
jgi:hypothetical protein